MTRVPPQDSELTARRLMRDGLGDDEIEALTGLSMMRLLAIRAGAAVEDREPPPARAPAAHDPQGRDPEP